jgi:hypothetical protein
MWCSGLKVKLRLHNRCIGRFEIFLVSHLTICELASNVCVQSTNISSIRCGNVYIAASVVRLDTLSFKSRKYRSIYGQQNHWITQNLRLIFCLWYHVGVLWVDWQVFRVFSFHCLVLFAVVYVHSVQQKSSGLVFHTSRSRSDVTYSCHHNSSRFTFLIFVHSWRYSVFDSL